MDPEENKEEFTKPKVSRKYIHTRCTSRNWFRSLSPIVFTPNMDEVLTSLRMGKSNMIVSMKQYSQDSGRGRWLGLDTPDVETNGFFCMQLSAGYTNTFWDDDLKVATKIPITFPSAVSAAFDVGSLMVAYWNMQMYENYTVYDAKEGSSITVATCRSKNDELWDKLRMFEKLVLMPEKMQEVFGWEKDDNDFKPVAPKTWCHEFYEHCARFFAVKWGGWEDDYLAEPRPMDVLDEEDDIDLPHAAYDPTYEEVRSKKCAMGSDILDDYYQQAPKCLRRLIAAKSKRKYWGDDINMTSTGRRIALTLFGKAGCERRWRVYVKDIEAGHYMFPRNLSNRLRFYHGRIRKSAKKNGPQMTLPQFMLMKACPLKNYANFSNEFGMMERPIIWPWTKIYWHWPSTKCVMKWKGLMDIPFKNDELGLVQACASTCVVCSKRLNLQLVDFAQLSTDICVRVHVYRKYPEPFECTYPLLIPVIQCSDPACFDKFLTVMEQLKGSVQIHPKRTNTGIEVWPKVVNNIQILSVGRLWKMKWEMTGVDLPLTREQQTLLNLEFARQRRANEIARRRVPVFEEEKKEEEIEEEEKKEEEVPEDLFDFPFDHYDVGEDLRSLLFTDRVGERGEYFTDIIDVVPLDEHLDPIFEHVEIERATMIRPYGTALRMAFDHALQYNDNAAADLLLNTSNLHLYDLLSAMRFYAFYETLGNRARMHNERDWPLILSGIEGLGVPLGWTNFLDIVERQRVFLPVTNQAEQTLVDTTMLIRERLEGLEVGTVAYIFCFLVMSEIWNGFQARDFMHMQEITQEQCDVFLRYLNIASLFKNFVTGEALIYWLFRRPNIRTMSILNQGDDDKNFELWKEDVDGNKVDYIKVNQTVPNRAMNIFFDQGDIAFDQLRIVIRIWLSRVREMITGFARVHFQVWIRRESYDTPARHWGASLFFASVQLEHDWSVANLDEVLDEWAEAFNQDLRDRFDAAHSNYGDDDEGLDGKELFVRGISIRIAPRVLHHNQLEHMNQLINNEAIQVFCRKTLGCLKPFAYFSQVTDRLCLYEVWHQLLNFNAYGNEWFHDRVPGRRQRIFADFLYEPRELQEICVEGSVNKFVDYLLLNHDEPVNVFFWEVGIRSRGWSETAKHTVVVKDAHVILCDTRTLVPKIRKRFARTVWANKNSTSGTYVLKPKKPKTYKMRKDKHYAWDIETCLDGEACVTYLICLVNIYDNNEKYVFEGLSSKVMFLKWLAERVDLDSKNKKGGNKKSEKIYLWGFNTNRFDLIFFLVDIFKVIGDADLIGSLTKVRKLTIGANIEFYDLWSACPCGDLESMVQSWLPGSGYEKGELPHEKIKIDTWEEYIDEARPYCVNDCVILGELVKKWITRQTKLGLTPFVMSCSQFALDYFRTYFLKENLTGLDYTTYKRVKSTYGGGLCLHAMQKLEEGVVYDFNSCYPAAMLEKVPVKHTAYHTCQISLDTSNIDLIDDCYIYYIIDYEWIDGWGFPFFFERDDTGAVQFYKKKPNSEPLGVWGETIKLALKLNLLKNPLNVIGIDLFESKVLFKEFVEKEYGTRLQAKADGDSFQEQLSKLVLNNLYGKFGQGLIRDNVWCTSEKASYILQIYKETNFVYNAVSPMPGIWNIEFDNWGFRNSIGGMVHIPALITSRCRNSIIKVIYAAQKLNLKFAYADTDSAHLSGELPDSHPLYEEIGLPNPLLHNTNLGAMKIEYAFTKAWYAAKKVYILKSKYPLKDKKTGKFYDDIIKCKGVPQRVLKSLDGLWDKYEAMVKTGKLELDIPGFFFRRKGFVEIKTVHKSLSVNHKRKFISLYESEPL